MPNKPAPAFGLSLATWFGCGLSPVAPGTAGSLAAAILAYVLHRYAGWGRLQFALMAAAVTAIGIWAAKIAADYYEETDPGRVVIDEVAGQWISLLGAAAFNWKTWLAAFALFRLFDIWKPAPVRQAERLPGGVGIMADDVLAGIYAALVLWAAGCFNLY